MCPLKSVIYCLQWHSHTLSKHSQKRHSILPLFHISECSHRQTDYFCLLKHVFYSLQSYSCAFSKCLHRQTAYSSSFSYLKMLLHLDTHQPPFKTFVMLFKISFQCLLKAFLLTDSVYSLSFHIPTSGNLYKRGRLSTVILLGLTSLYQVLLKVRTLFTFYKQATLMRRSTVLSLPLRLVFPALLKAFYQLKYFK